MDQSNNMSNTPQTVITDTTHSPYALLRPVPIAAVTLNDTFWESRRRVNREVMIPAQFQLCEETGRIDNLRKAAGLMPGTFEGRFFNDSDVYKLLEAASWSLTEQPDPELDARMDSIIEIIAAAQQPNGYLNSYFMGERAAQRWTNFDLHEMYCAGHLFQAAAAHYRCTDKTTLLNIAIRLADHICATFGPEEQGKRFGVDGHPEVEMGLVELYRITGDRKYLEQTEYFIDVRGSGRLGRPFDHQTPEYHQDNKPFREMDRLYGHSVRAVYLNCGAADLYAETGEQALLTALKRMWTSMVTRQMYAHGGLGSRWENEGFGTDYELPNRHAHAETCASVANMMWNWRMLSIEPDARYADVMELALYNSVLSGVSLDGSAYFYQNPLDDDGAHRRERWFTTACCPANIARTLAELPGYVYSTSENAIWVHLYVANTAQIALSDSLSVALEQQTDYPWSGDVQIQVQTAGEFALHLRVPGWCDAGWTLELNGEALETTLTPDHYLRISRVWQADDTIRLHLPMPAEWIRSHPLVIENQGRAALRRGPLLYCIEGVDNSDVAIDYLHLSDAEHFTSEYVPDLLGGLVVLKGNATLVDTEVIWNHALYQPVNMLAVTTDQKAVAITMIPYFAWANRAPSPMQIWLRCEI